ncbi:MAG: alpha-amylase family glycosyl hydrolase [Verrucomicrobiae bacterium]|nr:alpha-amylase family glycosyl hydrolase [Verrucomicrobiae bacterium]
MKKRSSLCRRLALPVAALISIFSFRADAALATVWHIPDNTGDLGFNMRNPEFAIGTSTAITFYTGVWKYNGAVQLCNQTGGTLYYKTSAQNAWSSTNLAFYSNTSANQYWQAPLNGALFNANDTVQYFFLLTFDGTGSTGATNTWLYGNNASSTATGASNTAAASPFTFTVSNNVVGTPVLTVNGVNADYTTTHVFVNELNNDAVPLTVLFTPNGGTVTNVELFSNLNRRDRATLDADGDGIEDGIFPPDGNLIAAGDDNNYYKAYTMTNVGGGQYSLVLNATKTGAYRLTARFKVVGNSSWVWYSGGSTGRRDHALVVTPTKARDMVMYELNAMNIDAQGTNQSDRSTFTDLYGGPGARPYDAVTNRFNLNYFQNLGVNWLWFQPIHPIGILNRQTDPNSGQPYSVGSPYSVKNFFQVNPLLSKANTRDGAMNEFTNFVAAADAAGVNVMLDEPFNHTAWDAELDASGVYYFKTNAQPTDLIANSEARFYSRSGEYDQRASGSGNVAQAPDRYDFGKWTDVADIYFGRYAALVPNSSSTGNYTAEGDWFDYSIGSESGTGGGNGHFDAITQNVWRYFSDSILYWLDKTGCPQGTPASQTYKGIDGLRADFGQGLPPQCWEYIINKVRTRKWDFVFMTESLDGGAVTYRSNRHFDILNENLLFDLTNAVAASDYRAAFDNRRNSYGQGLVLLNNVSHDEESYQDPYAALIRYMVCGAIDGAPMTFYGEELGISTTFGFSQYQLNFGKLIPHFMVYNSLQPILNPANRTYGLDQLRPVYAGVNQARSFSPALRSSNRYYLNQTGSETPQANIFSVAKYVTANGAPNFNDLVFAFTTLDRNNTQTGNFDVNITQNGGNLFGIKPARIYNVKNISAYTGIDGNRRNVWLWGGGVAGSNVLANGVFVSLNPVPAANGGWAGNPFEAQYLKLYDVTPPPAPAAPGTGLTNNYVYANSVTFSWPAVTDAEGGVSGYHVWVGTTPGGSNVFNGIVNGTTLSVTNSYGVRLYATVSAVNNASIESAASSPSIGTLLLNPAWVPVASMTAPNLLNWTSVSGLTYRVLSTTNLALPFTAYGGMVTATIPTLTFTNNPTNSTRYFRIQLIP